MRYTRAGGRKEGGALGGLVAGPDIFSGRVENLLDLVHQASHLRLVVGLPCRRSATPHGDNIFHGRHAGCRCYRRPGK